MVRQLCQQLYLNQDFLKPGMIIANRYAFAGKESQGNAIEDMLDEENDTSSASAKLPIDPKELLKVLWRKSSL